jgi:hypothetical protein
MIYKKLNLKLLIEFYKIFSEVNIIIKIRYMLIMHRLNGP